VGANVNIESEGGEIHLKSSDTMYLYGGGNVNIEAASSTFIEAGATIHYLAGTAHQIGNGEDIFLNGSALAATAAGDAAAAGPAYSATASIESLKAWIPDTMELLSIDLPNPRPAVGTSISQLALNEMKPAVGFGGENIRNLHDGIADMEKGLSAYVTKTYPATSEMKVYEMDQSEAYWTGMHQSVVQDPWNGETGEPQKQVPLGVERAIRYDPVAPPC
jgi:hypothetical protein